MFTHVVKLLLLLTSGAVLSSQSVETNRGAKASHQGGVGRAQLMPALTPVVEGRPSG